MHGACRTTMVHVFSGSCVEVPGYASRAARFVRGLVMTVIEKVLDVPSCLLTLFDLLRDALLPGWQRLGRCGLF